MNGSAAKELRRDIRRAVGPAVLNTMDAHAETIAALRNQIATLYEARAADAETAAKQRAADQLTVKMLVEFTTDWACFRQRTFWQRLRWLVTGR